MNPGKLSLRRRLALEAWRRLQKQHVERHALRQLFWESTRRCNVRCRHCGSDCVAETGVKDMPAEDFLRVVDSITPHVNPHTTMIIISGGEPLVRADLEDVGRELYRREYPWGIVTNGLGLTQERLQRLLASGLRSVAVSLDGLEDDHNWMRGNPASFRRAMEAIRMLARTEDVAFDVITCVNGRNISTLPEIKELLIEAGVKEWRLFTIFPSGRAKNDPELRISPNQYRDLMEFIIATRKEGRIEANYCCEGFLGNYEGEVRDAFYRCEAGVSVGSVLIDGSISGCASIRGNYVQGNIYQDDFWDVWSRRFEKYRDRAWMKQGQCADCRMWRYCEGNGMHLREDDGTLARCNLAELCAE